MPTRHFDIPNQARFLTFSCFHRRPLLDGAALRDRYINHLDRSRNLLHFRLHAWVIMPDHVHLIVLPVQGAISPVLRGLKQGFSRQILTEWREADDPRLSLVATSGSQCRFWQRGGGYDRNIRSPDELRRHTEYIHTNPVRRGLVERPEDWKWSSCAAWRGMESPILPDRLS